MSQYELLSSTGSIIGGIFLEKIWNVQDVATGTKIRLESLVGRPNRDVTTADQVKLCWKTSNQLIIPLIIHMNPGWNDIIPINI